MTATDLIVAIPLENIPNMPADPAGRQAALQAIRAGIVQHMASQSQGAPPPGAGAPPGGPPGGGMGAMGGGALGGLI